MTGAGYRSVSRRVRVTLALMRRRRWRLWCALPAAYGPEPVGLLDSLSRQPVTSRYGALQRTVGDVDNSGGYRVRHDGTEMSGSWPARAFGPEIAAMTAHQVISALDASCQRRRRDD